MNSVPQHVSLPHLRNRLARLHRVLSNKQTPIERIRILDREAVVVSAQILEIQNRLTDPYLQQALARGAKIPGFFLIDSAGVEIT
ncbi:hypothetical protein KKC88_01755 [Patescibacteria group bacterium]|nr:hypothetical protein [Patescibacteria group bacterium]MBU1673846.1 hypothetical protein [Patescibacteria group bacterium]MBU1963223.1 hypothetical protein [Patescibacteria group bacterium]